MQASIPTSICGTIICMSASTEIASGGLPQSVVRPAGLIWLGLCVAALAAGFWPQIFFLPKGTSPYSILPALQMVALAQVIWVVGVYPIVIQRRLLAGEQQRWWLDCAVESAWLIVAAGPVYLTAAWVADAVFADVLRMILHLICLWPLSLALGRLLAVNCLRGPVMFIILVILLGLPAAAYVLEEFYRSRGMEIVTKISPIIFAWGNARSRTGEAFCDPVWAAAIWPLAGAAMLLARLLFASRR